MNMSRHTLTFAACCILLAFFVTSPPVHARQQPDTREKTRTANRLPAADKIIADYIRAIGGKRRVATVRDAIYEWDIVEGDDGKTFSGRGKLEIKAPASTHWKLDFVERENYEVCERNRLQRRAPRGRWLKTEKPTPRIHPKFRLSRIVRNQPTLTPYAELTTLTGSEASTARLQSVVLASRLINYKKQNLLARTTGVENVNGEAAYGVELSTRDGARSQLSFSQTTKLLLRIASQGKDNKVSFNFSDYRVADGIAEPHRMIFTADGEKRRSSCCAKSNAM
jgi:hypothetical protein